MRQRAVACFLVLALLSGLFPAALALEDGDGEKQEALTCTQNEDCESETHDAGCPQDQTPQPAPEEPDRATCIQDGDCLAADHDPACPQYQGQENEKEDHASDPQEETDQNEPTNQDSEQNDQQKQMLDTDDAVPAIDYQKLYTTKNVSGGVSITGFQDAYVAALPAYTDGLKRIPVVIPAQINDRDVVAIDDRAFYEAVLNGESTIDPSIRITGISLSQAVCLKTIGDFAFYKLGNNTYQELSGTLTIPDGVTSIGNSAFAYLKGLTGDLLLPDSIEQIQQNAFSWCGFDGKLKLPNNEKYTTVSSQLVYDTAITELAGGIPENITTLRDKAFGNTKLSGDMVIPDTVTTLGSAFGGTQITSLVVPASVTNITSKYWINECTQLRFVQFHAIEALETQAFPLSHTSGGYNSDLTIVFPTKDAYERAKSKDSNTTYQGYLSYETTVDFHGLENDSPRRVLYNRPINWEPVPDSWTWSPNQEYAMPELSSEQQTVTYGWSFRQNGATNVDIVTPDTKVTGSTLYAVKYIPAPTGIKTSGNIVKTYDGQPATFTITVEHPYLASGEYTILYNWGKVVISDGWRKRTFTPINGCASEGSVKSKNTCEFKNVADSDINTADETYYQITWYMFHWNGSKWEQVKDSGLSGYQYFHVTITKGTPSIQPIYPSVVKPGTAWSDVSLSANENAPAGAIAWTDATGEVARGTNLKQWRFVPADSDNYEEVTGTAEIRGTEEYVVTASVSGEGGAVSPSSQTVEAGSDGDLTVTRAPGYQVKKILVNDADQTEALVGNTLKLPNITENKTVVVIFQKIKVEDITQTLPDLKPDQPPTMDEQETILDTKLDYEALEGEKQQVSDESRNQLNEALAALPSVAIKVQAKEEVPEEKIPTTDGLPALLENMTKDEAVDLKKGDISHYEIVVAVEAANPEGSVQESIATALGARISVDQLDVTVKKIIKTKNEAQTEETLAALARPIKLVFSIPQELRTAPNGMERLFTMLRTHQTEAGPVTEVLKDLDSDPTTYTIASDLFSVYTLAYEDTEKEGSHGSSHSSSKSAAIYTITADENTVNGSVTTDQKSAAKGSTVTITVQPKEGYVLRDLSVTGRSDWNIPLFEKRANQYTFSMPGENVVVSATFTQRESEPGTLPFWDVDADAWYTDAIRHAYETGLMNGIGANQFSPDLSATRGMIVQILYNLEGKPEIEKGAGFSDVAASAYFADAVAWASANQVVSGYGNGAFGPDDPITREQLAAILFRYARGKGNSVSARADLSSFTDASEISGYAVEAMQWANAEGLLQGVSATTLEPGKQATRAQVAAIFMRFCNNQ